MGMKGENVVNDTVWVVKSHSPWPMPNAPLYNVNKLFVVVRNPLDTVFSWHNLIGMNSHSTKCPAKYEEVYPEHFDWFMKDTCQHIKNWMASMMEEAKFRRRPILFLRYEDLVANPEPELQNLMRFLLGKKDLSGTNAERRINEVLAIGK